MRKQILSLSILLTVFSSYTLASDCNFKKTRVEIPQDLHKIREVANVTASLPKKETIYIFDKKTLSAKDKRKVKTSRNPKYLNAVGKIIVKTTSGHTFNCSGGLIDNQEKRSSKIVSSAYHCFKGSAIKDKTIKSITWLTMDNNGKSVKREAKILHLDPYTDTALLALDKKVPFNKVKPLLLLEDSYDEDYDESIVDFIDLWGESSTLAGFSLDLLKGDGGKALTFTDNLICDDMKPSYDLAGKKVITVKATSYGGGSGGTLVTRLDKEAREDLDLDPENDQEIFSGVAVNVLYLENLDESDRDTMDITVQKNSKNVTGTLFKSGVAHGSPETNVIGFDRFLQDDYFQFFELND